MWLEIGESGLICVYKVGIVFVEVVEEMDIFVFVIYYGLICDMNLDLFV